MVLKHLRYYEIGFYFPRHKIPMVIIRPPVRLTYTVLPKHLTDNPFFSMEFFKAI